MSIQGTIPTETPGEALALVAVATFVMALFLFALARAQTGTKDLGDRS